MKYDRITSETLSIIRKLPERISTESVSHAYNIDPAIIERNRPKATRTTVMGYARGEPIFGDELTESKKMQRGCDRLRDAMHAAYKKRHWADPHGWGAVFCGMRP